MNLYLNEVLSGPGDSYDDDVDIDDAEDCEDDNIVFEDESSKLASNDIDNSDDVGIVFMDKNDNQNVTSFKKETSK